MEKHDYAPEAKIFTSTSEVWRLYKQNDRRAGEIIDDAVRKRMQRTNGNYSAALQGLWKAHDDHGHALTSRPKVEPTPAQFVDAGVEIQKVVEDLQKTGVLPRGKSYLEDACKRNPRSAARYGYDYAGADSQELLQRYADGAREVKLHGEVSATSRLWTMINGFKLADGTLDWPAAARMAQQVPEATEPALKELLDVNARNWIRQQGTVGNAEDFTPEARTAIRRKVPDLAKGADAGASVTPEALKQGYPQFVK